jgi:ATP-binding cassette subfamily F protein 3
MLILDEPTNHLDIKSKDILKKALKAYDGTLIVVSHDRDFLDGLVDKLIEFKDKKIKEHSGSIYEFLKKKKLDSLKEIEKKSVFKQEKDDSKSTENKQNYLDRKETEKLKRKVANLVKASEDRITLLENKITEVEGIMSEGNGSIDQEFFKKYENLKSELELEMMNWEKLHNELEQFGV